MKIRKIKENKENSVCVVLVEFWHSSDVLRLFGWSKVVWSDAAFWQ